MYLNKYMRDVLNCTRLVLTLPNGVIPLFHLRVLPLHFRFHISYTILLPRFWSKVIVSHVELKKVMA